MDVRRAPRATDHVVPTRRDQAKDLVDRIPVLGRLVNEFVRIEFIDRCMLIAAQGLLALIPTFVVMLVAFFPHLMSSGVHQLAELTGLRVQRRPGDLRRGDGRPGAQPRPA